MRGDARGGGRGHECRDALCDGGVVHLPVGLLDLLWARAGLDTQLVVKFRLLHHLDAAIPGEVCSISPLPGCGLVGMSNFNVVKAESVEAAVPSCRMENDVFCRWRTGKLYVERLSSSQASKWRWPSSCRYMATKKDGMPKDWADVETQGSMRSIE